MFKVSDFRDRHIGKLGFVLGAGPSLHCDISKLADYVTISVNSSISKAQFADYFLADDIGVKYWNYYQHILPKLDAIPFLYRDKLLGEINHLDKKKIVWFKHKWWFDPKNKTYNPDGLVFTKDEPIIGARTAAGSAVHLLHIMGCDPIVLLGCDCCYKDGKRYYWQLPGEKPCYRLNGEKVFCTPNAGIRNGKQVDSHSVQFIEYWEALAAKADEANINIIDASEGLLTCFENKTLEKVLEEYGSRKKHDR